MSTVIEPSEPTKAEVDELVEAISQMHPFAALTPPLLARHILEAGWRKVPDPPPVQYGECRACTQAIELNDAGCLVDHDDNRRGRHCIGARNTPLRLVDPPEVVAADG